MLWIFIKVNSIYNHELIYRKKKWVGRRWSNDFSSKDVSSKVTRVVALTIYSSIVYIPTEKNFLVTPRSTAVFSNSLRFSLGIPRCCSDTSTNRGSFHRVLLAKTVVSNIAVPCDSSQIGVSSSVTAVPSIAINSGFIYRDELLRHRDV